jgi:hypothetical protein
MQESRLSALQMKVIVAAHVLADQHGALADVGRLLAVMAAVAPGRPEIIAAQARNLMFAKNYGDARNLLARAEAEHAGNAVIKSMLAMCMYIQKDGLWQAYAEEALALPRDAIAHGIVESIVKVSGTTLHGLNPAATQETTQPFSYMGLAC